MKRLLNNSIFSAFLILTVSLLLNGCYYDNEEELHPDINNNCDTTGTITYSVRISSIMTSRCGSGDASCHNGDNSESGIALNSFAGVSNSAGNTLMAAIRHEPDVSAMPKDGGQLDDCSIAVIQKWIDQGKQQ